MSLGIKINGPAQRLFPRCRLLPLVFSLGIVFAEPATATNPVLWGGLEPGSYKVGFTVLRLKDPSRSFGSSSSRPIQVSLWYPVAQKTSTAKPRMPFSDYVALYMTPVSSDRVLTSRDRTAAFDRYRKEWFLKEKQSDVARLLHTPTFCLRDAPPAEGHFPLVIYAPGYGAIPLTHTSTAEYLASHGYVVAMSPSQGESALGMTFDTAGQEEQVRDIEFTLGALRARPAIDSSRVALIGFSMGGGAVVIAGMRIPHVVAVISLDGSVAFDHTVDFLRQASGYSPARFRSPLLVLKAADDSEEDLSIVESLVASDRELIRLKDVEHHDFIASPVISSIVKGQITPSGKRAYPFVTRIVLQFLDEHTSASNTPLHLHAKEAEKSSAEPGEPTSDILLPKLDVPDPQQLIHEAMESGDIDPLLNAQRDLSRQVNGIPLLTAGEMNMIGLKLLDQERNDKAIRIYELFVDLYPGNFFGLNVLGDLYRERNDAEKAKECYRRSLAIRPGNGGAMDGLKAFEKQHLGSPSQ